MMSFNQIGKSSILFSSEAPIVAFDRYRVFRLLMYFWRLPDIQCREWQRSI